MMNSRCEFIGDINLLRDFRYVINDSICCKQLDMSLARRDLYHIEFEQSENISIYGVKYRAIEDCISTKTLASGLYSLYKTNVGVDAYIDPKRTDAGVCPCGILLLTDRIKTMYVKRKIQLLIKSLCLWENQWYKDFLLCHRFVIMDLII